VIATRDIGVKAAEFLNALKFKGSSVFELVGPKAITMTQATRIIGKAIGKPDLKYVQLSDQKAEEALLAAGMTHQVIKLYLEMNRGFNEGKFAPTQKMTPDHTGMTTFEEFAQVFSQIYRSTKKAA
jgi:uncharacterized protein YbjT (DUF2867 family)